MSNKKKSIRWDAVFKKFPKIRIPALRLCYRILLYLSALFFVVLSLLQVVTEVFHSILGIAIYALAAIALFLACYYLAVDVRYGIKEKVKPGINANPFTRRLAGDYRYRTVMFAVPGLMLNVIFALFNGIIGFYSQSAWYGTLSAYYILLSVMRFLAVRYDRKMSKKALDGEVLEKEIFVYHKCGILFLIMTVALGGNGDSHGVRGGREKLSGIFDLCGGGVYIL